MRLDSCWIWGCNNHPTTFLRYSAPPLDECKFATVIANSPTGGIGFVASNVIGTSASADLPIQHVLLDAQGLRAMSSTSPAWHFRRLVTMSHPKSIKTAKFTYCWLWILRHVLYIRDTVRLPVVPQTLWTTVCTKMRRFQSSQIVNTLEEFWLEKNLLWNHMSTNEDLIERRSSNYVSLLSWGGASSQGKNCR